VRSILKILEYKTTVAHRAGQDDLGKRQGSIGERREFVGEKGPGF